MSYIDQALWLHIVVTSKSLFILDKFASLLAGMQQNTAIV